jgi:glycogen operon protein
VSYATRPGSRFPPGASVLPDGVNFCIFSRHATRVELLLYGQADSAEPFQVIELSPEQNRTFFFWHVFVVGLRPRTYYTWRAEGPNDAQHTGRCFNPSKELVDPWARGVSDATWDRRRASDSQDAGHACIRAIVTEPLPARSEAVAARGLDAAIIYELHVGGFTRHSSSAVEHPGTFAGLREKIPYLRELGVTHVELLPVMAFDEQDVLAPVRARGLRNYWGYSTHSFHSPHPRYCIDPARAAHEFRALTDAFHDAGISVLLDVAFNHTAEGGPQGPMINFKGLANDIFYHLDAADRRRYRDYTGCGNTINCNHPLVSAFIVQCLEYWVEHMGVDGFRFDLASVFARDQRGEPMADPPVPWAIESSRSLSRVPLIAEAWDAAGLYHLGAFPGMAWAEWNGRYRDAIRRFVRGDPGLIGEVATCMAGSADLYAGGGRLPANSINFITCHDGFTLNDLVSYNAKHNEANGEDNRDGSNHNLSWNCGAEGESVDAGILELRRRQARNLMAILFLSQGVPMMLAGDETLRSQRGNNNAYCQDNELSWLDWRLAEANRDMLRFVRELIALRKRHPSLRRQRFLTGRPAPGEALPDVTWHGERLHEPPWHDPSAQLLAFTLSGTRAGEAPLHVILNMSDTARTVAVPLVAGCRWRRALDTALGSPQDIAPPGQQPLLDGEQYVVRPRAVAVLEGEAQCTFGSSGTELEHAEG